MNLGTVIRRKGCRMSATYDLVNWIMLAGAAVLGLAMGLNYLALLVARRQSRDLQSIEPDARALNSQRSNLDD